MKCKTKTQKLNRKETIRNILYMCTSRGYSINIEKFNKRLDDTKFLKEAAEFTNAEIIYF